MAYDLDPLRIITRTDALLHFISGTDIGFDSATKTITDVHAAFSVFSVGTKFVVSGTGDAANQKTFTVATIASDYKSITVDETVTDDVAGDTIYINEEFQSDWYFVGDKAKLVGSCNASQNCVVYIDQGSVSGTVDYTTTIPVASSTPAAWEISTIGRYARMRVRNNGTTQTTLSSALSGRSLA